ncbi:DNA helicase [Tanacetum coccineum]
MPTFFSDYIGCLRSTSSISDFGDPNRRQGVRRKIEIKNLNGNIVECTLWDEMANHFGKADIHSMEQPVIIAISSCRVSKYTETSLDPPWSDLELYLCGDEFLRLETLKYWDITELFRAQVYMPRANPVQRILERFNVQGIKLFSYPESYETALRACKRVEFCTIFLVFYGLFSGPNKLNISLRPSKQVMAALSTHKVPSNGFSQKLAMDGSEFDNRNLQVILANGVVSYSTLSDQGYAEDFYDQ